MNLILFLKNQFFSKKITKKSQSVKWTKTRRVIAIFKMTNGFPIVFKFLNDQIIDPTPPVIVITIRIMVKKDVFSNMALTNSEGQVEGYRSFAFSN